MLAKMWLVILLTHVPECGAFCVRGDVTKSCKLDIGTIVGIVIGSIVALILVVMVILLACSHLRYITGRDMLDYEDDAVISHDPSGATVVTIGQPPQYPGSGNEHAQET